MLRITRKGVLLKVTRAWYKRLLCIGCLCLQDGELLSFVGF